MKGDYEFEDLRAIGLFSDLSDQELKEVTGRLAVKRFKKHGVVLHEEDTNEFFYMILSGGVKVVRTTEDGREMILALHREKEFFGEMTLIDGKTVPATVVATDDSLIALIGKKDFYSLLFTQSKVLQGLLGILCQRLRESWEKMKILTYRDASLRIRTLFLMLSREYGEPSEEGTLLNIKLTHQGIADMTGLSRETVTRMLDRLQKAGEITLLKDRLIRLSPGFLEKDLRGI